jgi:hypothetical protein
VAVVGANPLAVVRVPGADVLVLCYGEDDVAIAVVSVWWVGEVSRTSSAP